MISPQRLDWHLANWARYMRTPSNELGYPSVSIPFESGGGAGVDAFELLCQDADTASAIQLNALIESLALIQQLAVNHVWLASVFRLRDLDTHYELALTNLLHLSDKRGMV